MSTDIRISITTNLANMPRTAVAMVKNECNFKREGKTPAPCISVITFSLHPSFGSNQCELRLTRYITVHNIFRLRKNLYKIEKPLSVSDFMKTLRKFRNIADIHHLTYALPRQPTACKRRPDMRWSSVTFISHPKVVLCYTVKTTTAWWVWRAARPYLRFTLRHA